MQVFSPLASPSARMAAIVREARHIAERSTALRRAAEKRERKNARRRAQSQAKGR